MASIDVMELQTRRVANTHRCSAPKRREFPGATFTPAPERREACPHVSSGNDVTSIGRSAIVVLLAVLAGCGTSDDRDQARGVVERFYDAVRHDRAAEACAQLSDSTIQELESQSGQSCAAVITRLRYTGGAIVRAEVYITNAKVDLRGGESAFLDRQPTGWKLTAIGCRPEEGKPRDRPLQCEVQA
jgi:hypothetical protein